MGGGGSTSASVDPSQGTPCSRGSVGSVEGKSLVRTSGSAIFDDRHCDRIHSFLTVVHCPYDDYVGKQAVVWVEYCAKYWLKEPMKAWIGALAAAM